MLPHLRKAFKYAAADLEIPSQKSPHAYSVMLLQNIAILSRPHSTTGKKHYLLLHETHCFWAKRFGLVLSFLRPWSTFHCGRRF